jgi:hypothetical protein
MPNDLVRTTVDIPGPIYRKLKEQAARQGCSVRVAPSEIWSVVGSIRYC